MILKKLLVVLGTAAVLGGAWFAVKNFGGGC
jgi:hypothetical protein